MELRKLSQALRLDPGSTEAYNLQLGYTSQAATDAAMRLAQLKDAAEEVGERKVSIDVDGQNIEGTLSELRQLSQESTPVGEALRRAFESAAATTATAQTRVESYKAILDKMHGTIEGLADQMAALHAPKLQEELGAIDLSDANEAITQMRALFDALPVSVQTDEKAVSKLMDEVKKLAAVQLEPKQIVGDWDKQLTDIANSFGKVESMLKEDFQEQLASANPFRQEGIYALYSQQLEKVKNASLDASRAVADNLGDSFKQATSEAAPDVEKLNASIADTIEKASKLSGLDFRFDSGTSDFETIETALKEMLKDLHLNEDSVANFLTELKEMQGGFSDADAALKQANLVQKFQDLIVEIVKGEAQVENLSKALSDMRLPSNLLKNMYDLTTHADVLRESYQSLMSTGDALKGSLNVDPGNVDVATAAIAAYSGATIVAREHTAVLEAQLEKFDASGLDEISTGSMSATEYLYSTSVAAAAAKRSLSEVEGEIAHLENTIGILEGRGTPTNQIITPDAVESLTKAEQEAITATNAIGSDLEKLRARLASLKDVVGDLRKAEREAADESQGAKRLKEYEDLNAAILQAKTSLLEAARAETEMFQSASVSDAFGESVESLREYGSMVDAATKRAEALDKAAKVDSTSVELAAAKTQALADAQSLAKKYADEVAAAISKVDMSKVEQLRQKYGDVSTATKAAQDAVTAYTLQLQAAREELDSLGEGDGTEQAQLKIREVTVEANRLEAALKAARSELSTASEAEFIEGIETKAYEAKAAVESIGKEGAHENEVAFQQVFDRISQYAERAGRAIVESASTIDEAYRSMRKTVQGSEQDFAALLDAATKFSQTNAVSTDTILSIESLGGQLGVTVDKLQEFGEVASSLEIATDMTAEQISLKLGQITNVMSDLNFDTFDNFADALVRLGNNTATTESQIMEVAQRMAAVANVTSMTTPQLLGWSAAIASTGMHSESAATSITRTITGIGQAVADGGTKLEQFAKIAGMSADEFKKRWENSSSEALEAFIKGLQGLSDDSTDAIEALDAVGISSVRQETSLLALSQTVQNLDNAVRMSKDAFDGVGDEFGQAGDAAREAGQMSEGFSGSLKILGNNAANLAASLGEGLMPAMNLLSGAMALVTDFMNAMPEPMKNLITTTGALAIGIAAVDAALRGIGGEAIIPKLAEMSAGMLGLGAASGEAAVGVGALGTALMAIPAMAAIAAVTVIVTELASAIGDEIERAKIAKEATDGLTESVHNLGDAYSETSKASNGGSVGMSLNDVREATDAMMQSLADLSDSIDETHDKLASNAGQVEYYASVLKDMGDGSSLTSGEMAILKDAVARYNEITGASIEITSEHRGTLNLLASQIDEVTEAYERQAKNKAYLDLMAEINKKQVENRMQLDKAKQKLEEYEQGLLNANTTMENIAMLDTLFPNNVHTDLLRQIQDLEKSGADLAENYKYLKEQFDDTASFETAEAAMVSIGIALKELDGFTDGEKHALVGIQNELLRSGDSLENYGNLTADQLRTLIDAYGEGEGAITAALKKISEASTDAAETVKKANDEQVKALQRTQEAAYTEAKRAGEDRLTDLKNELDAEYDARKRALDADYDLQKQAFDREQDEQKRALDDEYQNLKQALDREYDERKRQLDREYSDAKDGFDKIYNERKKALDAEYEELKSQLDKIYNERKKALDKELDALKSSLDKNYNEQKKALDKSYNERKKALDKELDALKDANDDEEDALKKHLDELYNARKKAYDKEYKQYQKENDKILKELKKKQSKEIDEFKDTTSEYIKELKKRYKAAKEEAEKNDGRSEIDAEIERLKAETEAERDAIEAREQAEKTAELKKNVEQAKTRKTRQEAEKALSDYLAEVEQKAREKSREAEIKKLEDDKDLIKDKTDAKKDALDEELDQLIEDYQKERDLQLEHLQELHDAEYEKEQERLDNLEALRKEALDKKLADYRAELDAELEALNKQNEDEEDALAEKHSGMLETLKENNEAELALLKESQQARIDAAKEANDLELESVKTQHQAILDARKEANETELSDLKAYNETQLEEIKLANELELENLKTANQAVLDEKKLANDLALEDLKLYHQNSLNEMKIAHQLELEDIKLANDAKITEMRRANEDELTDIKNLQKDKLDAVKKGADEVTKTAGEKANETANKVDENLKKIPGYAKLTLMETRLGVGNEFGTMKSDTHKTMDEIQSDVQAQFAKLKDHAKEGSEGAARGLKEGYEHVVTEGKALGKGALLAWDEATDSHSPSREMEKRGEGAVEGLVNGMDSKESDIENTTTRLADVVKNRFDEIETRGYGENAGSRFESGLASTEYAIQNTADNLARSASDPLDGVQNWTENSGYNAGINFNNGLASAASWIYDTALSIADSVASILHHSTPDEGPLKHDDEWGSDLVQNIIDGMRDRESDLLRQTRRMAEIVERGFDPEMTVDAAYEAIDTIRRGNMRDIASAQSMSTSNNQVVNVNVTLSDVTIREDADIRRLAEEIASMMRRKEAATIGW
jgi:TP901 family phage tail tape measure protein